MRLVSFNDDLDWEFVFDSRLGHPARHKRATQSKVGDVATIAEKSGKSASHVYARLSLLQLIPAANANEALPHWQDPRDAEAL